VKELIIALESEISDARLGLPDEIFYFVGRLTPFVNVDLLLRDSNGRCFFSWRDDPYSGAGWHLPGGIIRYKETFINRVHEVARLELGIELEGVAGPIAINEIIDDPKKERAHFISLLYECRVSATTEVLIERLASEDPNKFLLQKGVPLNLLKWHDIYTEYINR
jgi:colanic acid biosynthesis protein WcaH